MLHKSFRYPVLAVCIASLCLISGLTVAQHATAALTTFETDDFSGSGVCAFCHSRLRDEAGNDVSNDAQWRSTMMANAAKDPLWQAKISAEIDTSSFSPNQSLFGPYNRPARNPIQRNTGFLPTDHAPDRQLSDSAHCGSCRTLCTPSLTADGTYIKAFPEQTTYLEWEHSQFDLTCQDCRLPEAVGSAVISNRPRRLAARSPFGQHHYIGGNSYMINLLKTHAANLGVTADATHLDATVSRTLAQLQQNTATVTATASLTDTGDRLQVTVDVTNLAGHKFPSGLPSRRAWLHVTVSDIGEDIIFESGRPFENGSIEGNDADINMADFEPHYDEITSSGQVQIYEPVMRNNHGEVTYTLLRAWEYIKDNRLMPAGFNKNQADPDIGVYGGASVDANFQGGSDQVIYDLDVSRASGKLTVTVELLFQTLPYLFIADLAKTETALVGNFMGLYNPADNVPVVVDAAQMSVR